MLHDAGASTTEAHAYLERWGLMTPELAAHLIRFLTEPTSRTYMITYAAGRELCRAYVAGDPERFRRLLTEQVRVRDLLETRRTLGSPRNCRPVARGGVRKAQARELREQAMPKVGIEPTLPGGNRILSPARLPVPPLRPQGIVAPSACASRRRTAGVMGAREARTGPGDRTPN